jgi:hypothetical protein
MPDIGDKLLEAYETLGIKVGDLFEDCSFHPVLCLGVDYQEDEIWGVSLIDGSYPRSCSLLHCGVRKLSEQEAWQIKLRGPSDENDAALIALERRWWNVNPALKEALDVKGTILPRKLPATSEEGGSSTS